MSADFAALGRLFYEWARNNLNLWEWEVSEELLPLFQQCGMVEQVAYDPTHHGVIEDADPGDTIWHWTMPARAALEADPAPVVGAPTLQQMDEICCEHNFHYEDQASLEILVEIASAVLARYATTPAPVPDDAEVAALVAALRDPCVSPLLRERTRAADLLERGTTPAPVPVPVGERLPEVAP